MKGGGRKKDKKEGRGGDENEGDWWSLTSTLSVFGFGKRLKTRALERSAGRRGKGKEEGRIRHRKYRLLGWLQHSVCYAVSSGAGVRGEVRGGGRSRWPRLTRPGRRSARRGVASLRREDSNTRSAPSINGVQ